ncbi:protein RIC-3 isoform X2 [Paroedura picta]|uniref:protein RIC-3 isoform X2 n=1 Tax=Paroedura picta TaxID=143630 RepID=UPI00405794DE
MVPATFRKVAAASCLVLCVSLLLPKLFLSRVWSRPQELSTAAPAPTAPAMTEEKTSRLPPTMQHQMSPEARPPVTHFPRSHLAEAVAKAKGGGGGGGGSSGGGGGGGGGRGLVGQVIPIYGFGILLYILYILFKLSSKGKTTTAERKCLPSVPGNVNRKITDYELAQLQDKLRETEEAMEKLINRVGPNCESRAQNVTTDQEKRLLQQLREITKVIKEGKLIDGISPEKEAEEAPYMQDWQVNNELMSRQEKDQQATFIGHSQAGQNFEKCHCCRYEDDDPAVIAENEGFYPESCSETEELAKEELLADSDHENSTSKDQHYESPDQTGMLRKRNTRGLELLGK